MAISSKKFIILNILIILISSILIFYGIDGSIQERINILKDFSIPSIKLILKTLVLLFVGFIFLFSSFQILKVSPITYISKNKYWLLIISWILYFISLTLLLAKRWAEDRFPMQQPEIIFLNAINYNGEGIDNIYVPELIFRKFDLIDGTLKIKGFLNDFLDNETFSIESFIIINKYCGSGNPLSIKVSPYSFSPTCVCRSVVNTVFHYIMPVFCSWDVA